MGVVYFSIIPTFEPSRYYKCWIVCFYNKNMLEKYMKSDLFFKLGLDKIDKFKLISFNVSSDAKYTVDEICTFINWVNNTIYVKDLAICISSEEQMHKKLNELMEISF